MTERLPTSLPEVTARQREVARLVSEGLTNDEIALRLGVSPSGAKYHVSELLGRLGLERREEIAQWYRTAGTTETPRPVRWRGWQRAAFALGAGLLGAAGIIAMAGGLPTGGLQPDQSRGVPPVDSELTDSQIEPTWEVDVANDYEPQEFIVAICFWGHCPNSPRPEVRLISAASGETQARLWFDYQPLPILDAERGRLIVSYQSRLADTLQHQVAIFDLNNALTLIDEFTATPRSNSTTYWPSNLLLSADGEWLYYSNAPTGGAGDPSGTSNVELATRRVTWTYEPECPTAPVDRYGADGVLVRRCPFGIGAPSIAAVLVDGSVSGEWVMPTGAHATVDDAGHPVVVDNNGLVYFVEQNDEIAYAPLSGDSMRRWQALEAQHLANRDLVLGVRIPAEAQQSGAHRMQLLAVLDHNTHDVVTHDFGAFTSFHLHEDGGGVYLLLGDGTIESVDWDGARRSVPGDRLEGDWLLVR